MGYGLGRNSPIQLSLGRENYEALIERHGQWVRWRRADKCPCVKGGTQQPDLHCPKCGGLGYVYSYQKKAELFQSVMEKDGTGVLELSSEYKDCSLLQCYDNAGVKYPKATKIENFLFLNSEKAPEKGVYITAIMEENILHVLENAKCENLGNNYFRVQGLRVSRTNIDGLYHTAPSDIESISKVTDIEGNIYEVDELRQDTFHIVNFNEDGIEASVAGSLNAEEVRYIPPFVFVILRQELNRSDVSVMQENGGDAVLTFPYAYDVALDDVITVLSGTYTLKSVLTRKDAKYDTIPAYFVEEITSLIGKKRDYVQGLDFALCGANYIKWLCEDAPEEGEAYSITYKVYPTYRVVKNIPQIRTSENQRMPKKAVIKLYDTYGEARSINRQ